MNEVFTHLIEQVKTCHKCGLKKDVSEFYPSYPSQCKSCHYPRTLLRHRNNPRIIEQRRRYRAKYPWLGVLLKINYRCNNPKSDSYPWYGGKGIKNELNLDNVKFLWLRDNATNMAKPSIDRVDPNKNYTMENCRFIEHSENVSRAH